MWVPHFWIIIHLLTDMMVGLGAQEPEQSVHRHCHPL